MIPQLLLFVMLWNAPEPSNFIMFWKPAIVVSAPQDTRKQDHRNKVLLWTSTALVVSSIADIEISLRKLDCCCCEVNPILRPFMRNRATAYGFTLALDAVTIYLAHRYQKPWLPLISAGAHGFAVSWNVAQ